jgi:phage shock protein C
MKNRLYRNTQNKVLGGVCAGLADYFDTDPVLVRLLFVFGNVLGFSTFLIYVVLWVVLPPVYPPFDFTAEPIVTPPPFNPKQQPVRPKAAKKRSNFGVVFGALLIAFGVIFLLLNFNIVPTFVLSKGWPVLMIVWGLYRIFGGGSRPDQQPWDDYANDGNTTEAQTETQTNTTEPLNPEALRKTEE